MTYSPADALLEFLKDYGNGKYRERVREMARERRKDITIDFDDLIEYKSEVCGGKVTCQWVDSLLPYNAWEFLKAAKQAVRELMRIETPEYVLSPDEIEVKLAGLPDVFKLSIRDIYNSTKAPVGRLAVVKGVVKEISDPLVEAHVLTFVCKTCGFEVRVVQEGEGKVQKPVGCPKCEAEGRKSEGFRLAKEKIENIDVQSVVLMEALEDIPPGSKPLQIEAIVRGSLVNEIKPGDLLLATVIVDVDVTKPLLKSGLPMFRKVLSVVNVERLSKDYSNVTVTDEDKRRFLELAKRNDYLDVLVNSFAPDLDLPREVKLGVLLQLFGCDSIYDNGNRVLRGEIHVLIVGDPSTGKSKLLRTVARIFPRSLYVSMKRASEVGLTLATVRDERGRYTTSAGVVVLADKGIACIDEFDKVEDPSEYDALHEPMEDEIVTKATAAGYTYAPARTSILAAANPKGSFYDPGKPFQENVELPPTILSRFDLIFLLLNRPDEEKDRERVRFIRKVRMGRLREERKGLLSEDDLRKLIVFARENYHPKMTDEAWDVIEDAYVSLRQKWVENEKYFPYPVLDRTYDTLQRLAMASARMHLRDVVTREDATLAVSLFNYTIDRVLEVTRTEQPRHEGEYEKKPAFATEMVLHAVRELQGDGCVDVEKVVEWLRGKLDEKRVREAIEKMVESGWLMEIKRGCVKLPSRID